MKKILVLWDIILDKYSYWEVKRLNPEWPNPLLNIQKEEFRLGWSANVAANIASLYWSCDLIWLIWEDSNWETVINLCKEKSINFLWLKGSCLTITKQRFIESTYEQQILRVDYEDKMDLNFDEAESICTLLASNNYEYILISDYNKGIVNKNIIDFIKKLNIKILVDAKPKNINLFENVYLVKPNFKEFCTIIWEEINNSNDDIEKYWKEFVKRTKTNLIVTRWKYWASIITQDLDYYHIPTEALNVFDVTWAWDTFIATIWYALLEWYNLIDAVKLWNKASSIVIWKIWTEIVNINELWK